MARLPTPGGDTNNWGTVLNDFLSQAHNADGSLKTDSVGSAALADNAVTNTTISASADVDQSKIHNLTTDLSAKAPLASPTFTGTVTVPTPSNATDASTKAYVDSAAASGTPDANGSTKGKIQLAGDLAGAAAAPAVSKIKGIDLPASAPTAGQVLTATGTTATGWQTPASAPVSSVNAHTGAVVLAKTDVGLGNVDNTNDLGKPISATTQTALDAKAPLASLSLIHI